MLTEFCQENALVIANTQKTLHMDITRWISSKIRLIIFFAAKDGEALYSQQKQDWELTVAQINAKFRLKQKKEGKTTKPFSYDLNLIPYYYYIIEVTYSFKGLDLIDRVPDELWMEVCDILPEAVIKTIPKKNGMRISYEFISL